MALSLTNQQIRALRAESHRLKLKPVVMIGHNGLSENVVHELNQALDHHELIKVRIPGMDKDEKAAFVAQVCQQTNAVVIQKIGHVIVLFRQNDDNQRFRKLL